MVLCYICIKQNSYGELMLTLCKNCWPKLVFVVWTKNTIRFPVFGLYLIRTLELFVTVALAVQKQIPQSQQIPIEDKRPQLTIPI